MSLRAWPNIAMQPTLRSDAADAGVEMPSLSPRSASVRLSTGRLRQ